MSELLKIIGIAIAGGMAAMTVRKYNAAFGMLIALAVGAGILLSLCTMLEDIVSELNGIIEAGGIDSQYIKAVFKVTGIAYITQFAAQMLRDGGESAVAAKCELAGKLFILYLTLPVVGDFLKMCVEYIGI